MKPPIGSNHRGLLPASLQASNKLATKDKSFTSQLIHQQCWCWGRDILSCENLLLQFGFTRHRPPSSARAGATATRYELNSQHLHLALWGFGLWVMSADRTQGFISRNHRGVWLLPKAFDISHVHSAQQVIPALIRPRLPSQRAQASTIAIALANWCQSYERWITQHAPPGHRQATVQAMEHPLVPAHDMPAAWQRVKSIYKNWYGQQGTSDWQKQLLHSLHSPKHPPSTHARSHPIHF